MVSDWQGPKLHTQEIRAMMRDTAEERAKKRRRTRVGGEVPADSHQFVTPAVQAVRDKAAKRQAAKEQPKGAPSAKARARPGTHRWVGRPSTSGQTPASAGQTAASAGQPAANPGVVRETMDILLPTKSFGFDVLARRRFYLLGSLAEMAARATRKRIPPSRRVMVLRDLHPATLSGDSEAVWCRISWALLDQ